MAEIQKKRIIVGVSGASGIPVAKSILQFLHRKEEIETHLVITDSAALTIGLETDDTVECLKELADVVYDAHCMGAAIASGSFQSEGMIIVPCSMKTVAGIASGYSDNLLLRAADCMLKEGRKLVLVVRECPFNQIHLRNMTTLLECGARIYPMMMTFYNRPSSIEDMIFHISSKVLEYFGIDTGKYKRWGEEPNFTGE